MLALRTPLSTTDNPPALPRYCPVLKAARKLRYLPCDQGQGPQVEHSQGAHAGGVGAAAGREEGVPRLRAHRHGGQRVHELEVGQDEGEGQMNWDARSWGVVLGRGGMAGTFPCLAAERERIWVRCREL